MDDTNSDVNEEVVTPEDASEGQSPDSQERSEPQRGSSEYNFREMRRIIERQQYEIDELKTSRQQPEEPEEPEEFIPDDEIPNARQVRKLIEKEAHKKAQALLKQRDLERYEQRLKQKYNDFDSVVTKENVEELVHGNQRLLNQLVRLNKEDPEEASELAYELIKKSAFWSEKARKPSKGDELKKKAAANSAKPVSSSAIGSTPTPLQSVSNFKMLSDEEKHKLWREMETYAGRR